MCWFSMNTICCWFFLLLFIYSFIAFLPPSEQKLANDMTKSFQQLWASLCLRQLRLLMCWTWLISLQMKRPEECSTHMKTVMHVCALLSTKETISMHAWIFISAIRFKCIFSAGSAHWRSLRNVHTANMEHTEVYMGGLGVGWGVYWMIGWRIMYTTFIIHTIHAYRISEDGKAPFSWTSCTTVL